MLSPRFRVRGGTELIALALIAVLVTAFAVSAAPADPTALRSTYNATTKAQAFRFASTRTITIGTDTTPDISFATNGEQVGQDRLHTSTMVTSGSIQVSPFETTQLGRDQYIHLTGSLTPNGADQWLELDVLGGLLSGLVSPIVLQQASPGDALALLNDVTDAQTIGDETINGVNTTHLQGTIDLARATAGNGPLAGLGNIYAGPQSTVAVDAYIGKDDGLVHRLAFLSKADVDLSTLNLGGVLGEPSGAISTNATTNAMFDFTDYNAAGITVNPPVQFMRVSDYLNNFNLSIVVANPQPTMSPAPVSGISAISTVSAASTAIVTATTSATGTTTATGTVITTAAGTRFPPLTPTVGR